MHVICWESSGNAMVLPPKQLHTAYTDVRNSEQLFDFSDKNECPKVTNIVILMFQRTLEYVQLEEEYTRLDAHQLMVIVYIYIQISY